MFLFKILSPAGVWNKALPASLISTLDALSTPPAGDSYYGARAESYNSIRSVQDWWHEEQLAVRKILRSLSGVSTVLDVPVGTGRFFEFYKDLDLEVSGLDLSKHMIRQASQVASDLNLAAQLQTADAVQIPFEENSFDLVVCFRFLQSIVTLGDARKVIFEIGRVTSRYAILELDFCEPAARRAYEPRDFGTMRNRFTQNEVQALLRRAGLEVKDVVGPFRKSERSQYAFVCEKRA